MDANLKAYLDSGEYVPELFRDFHDQKTLFKRLNQLVQNRKDETKDVDWVSAHIYTIDVFLWFMAKHGYTLQRSRKKLSFEDLGSELHAFEEARREESSELLKQLIGQHFANKKKDE